jgi:hypothetical protein
MTAGIWFWIIYVISILFTGYWWWPFTADRAPWLVVYILIGLLGWGVFGAPIR